MGFSTCVVAGSELVIGPWSHAGVIDQSVGQKSSFDQAKHSIAFINRCCNQSPHGGPGSVPGTIQPPQQLQPPSQQGEHQLATRIEGGCDSGATCEQHDQQRLKVTPSLSQNGTTAQSQAAHAQLNGTMGDRGLANSSATTGFDPSGDEEEDVGSPAVHFFMMGCTAHRGWKACHSWPPPHASSPPLKLYLGKTSVTRQPRRIPPNTETARQDTRYAGEATQPPCADDAEDPSSTVVTLWG